MPTLVRLVHVLRRGPRPRRLQAWAGLLLVGGASLWLIVNYLTAVAACFGVALLGFVLLRRSLKDSRPSS